MKLSETKHSRVMTGENKVKQDTTPNQQWYSIGNAIQYGCILIVFVNICFLTSWPVFVKKLISKNIFFCVDLNNFHKKKNK